jgi:hypothetical protein
VLRAARIAEAAGVPGVAIVSSGFMQQARATARAMGIPDVSIAEYPGMIPMDSDDQLADKIWNKVLPDIVTALSTPVPSTVVPAAEPDPRDIVFSGSLAEVQEYFHQREWSDGLPVVPPTIAAIDDFLAWTERAPSEVIGVLPPEFREATVWSVAVNGVMAGCRPEYMPVLIALAEAVSDPDFRLVDAGSTPGWEFLIVASGEIVDALDFNTEAGNMKIGRQANASIGRFLRMFVRNVAGFRPGGTDKGSISFTFNVAMAENEGAVRALGWDPVRVDLGFAPADNVVMVQSVIALSAPVYSGGTDPQTLAWPLVRYMQGTAGPYAFTALAFSRWHPLIQMSPSVAEAFASHGWGKREIRNYLFEQCRIDARSLEHYQMHVAGKEVPLAELVRRGSAPALYAQSDDPARLLPMLLRPEWTSIVIAGDPGRNQSRIYINNHDQGPPVTKRIRLPGDWRTRLAAAPRRSR